MTNFKNIVFDLGGVVIDLQRERAVKALQNLGLEDADDMLGLYIQKEPFLDLETGRCTAGEFFDHIRRLTSSEITDLQIQEAFNAFLVDLPVERLRAIRRLREKGYNTYVVSNTNPVMFNSWITSKFRQEGLTVNDYFNGIVCSFQELCCKPNPEIFRLLLKRYALDPGKTVMLDDSEKNCEAAKSVGMHAIQINNAEENSMLNIVEKFVNICDNATE